MLLSLIVAGCLCCSPPAQVTQQEKAVETNSEITLTDNQPTGRIELQASVRAGSAPILEVPITAIANPQETSFSIFVYLEWTRSASAAGQKERVPVGNFTVYPATRTGTYTVRASKGFEKLKQMGADLRRDHVVLLLELERVHKNKPWTPLQVTIASPQWRSDP